MDGLPVGDLDCHLLWPVLSACVMFLCTASWSCAGPLCVWFWPTPICHHCFSSWSAETCVFKPWVASSFLEGLGVTRIALFSSQARMWMQALDFRAESPLQPRQCGGCTEAKMRKKVEQKNEFGINVEASRTSIRIQQSTLLMSLK